jgi:hypothetical protein
MREWTERMPYWWRPRPSSSTVLGKRNDSSPSNYHHGHIPLRRAEPVDIKRGPRLYRNRKGNRWLLVLSPPPFSLSLETTAVAERPWKKNSPTTTGRQIDSSRSSSQAQPCLQSIYTTPVLYQYACVCVCTWRYYYDSGSQRSSVFSFTSLTSLTGGAEEKRRLTFLVNDVIAGEGDNSASRLEKKRSPSHLLSASIINLFNFFFLMVLCCLCSYQSMSFSIRCATVFVGKEKDAADAAALCLHLLVAMRSKKNKTSINIKIVSFFFLLLLQIEERTPERGKR